MTRRRRVDVDLDELDQIIDRGQQAPLSEAERSTERTSAVLPPHPAPAEAPEDNQTVPTGHGRNPSAAYHGASQVGVAHPTLHSGDICPECRRGKVYRQKEPARLVRFVGQAPLEATVFERERLRCNACGEVFTAEEPETAGAAKYDETALAMIAVMKYGTGMAFKRLERLQSQLGMPLPAATQWELGPQMGCWILTRAPRPVERRQSEALGRPLHHGPTGPCPFSCLFSVAAK